MTAGVRNDTPGNPLRGTELVPVVNRDLREVNDLMDVELDARPQAYYERYGKEAPAHLQWQWLAEAEGIPAREAKRVREYIDNKGPMEADLWG